MLKPRKNKRKQGYSYALDGVTAVEYSHNSKLGTMSATYASIVESCWKGCAMFKKCYARKGNVGVHTARLHKQADGDRSDAIAKREAACIAQLSAPLPLRVHVSGDCRTDRNATIVGHAMVDYVKRLGQKAYTYTHSWRKVHRRAWGSGIAVLASCETVEQFSQARKQGYRRFSVVVDKHLSPHTWFTRSGTPVVPCPNQTKGVKCADCGLCLTESNKPLAIAFEVH